MNGPQAIILGVTQGLTEFLPVSSSGHLVLLQNLFGLHKPELLFDISLHVGTLMAVCVVFRRDILSILGALIRVPVTRKSSLDIRILYRQDDSIRLAWMIVMGNIPTAVLGLLFHRIADQIFGTVGIAGAMLLVTGTFLWLSRYIGRSERPVNQMTVIDALLIGLVQGLAILPGISRSGATISMALFLGLNRELAGRYSFLLSIPAILGALVLEIDFAAIQTHMSAGSILSGTVVAGIVGYSALLILLRVVKGGRLYLFSPYCWLIGAAALIWHAM